ncbi:AMMECR1 domain-containing protein [Microbacterium deminutum]
MIRDQGVLRSTPERPILDRDGTRADWMLYTYPVTLSAAGGRLVADSLLPVLRTFAARQLVSVGYTALPIMSACILQSGGEFVGACIRESPKAYGTRRRIEGAVDPGRPVVLIDDSISSGRSIKSGIQALEEAGYDVEGVVALVHFPWRGGVEWARANGYRVELLMDVWRDVGMPLADHAHGFRCVGPVWSERTVASGLHPAYVAREVATEMLGSGRAPRPPSRLDREYDGSGGVYVSFRDRATDHRVARSGFWHFDPADGDAARDVVLATVRTVRGAERALAACGLDRLKIAVSFLGPLERIEPCDLDYDRLGLVVRSTAQPGKVGGALPHTQVFTSDIEQYRHAAYRNARLGRSEPHELFVHTVSKVVEPGHTWLPYGSSDDGDEHLPLDVGARLTARAAEALHAELDGRPLRGAPLPDDLLPDPVHGIGVTLYARGVIGCCISSADTVDACVTRAARTAANDPRFAHKREAAGGEPIAVCVSVLRDRELLDATSDLSRALVKPRPGEDTVGVQAGSQSALFLPQVGVHYGWDRAELARQLLAKARITGGQPQWASYRTTSWVRAGGDARALRAAFPDHDPITPDLPTLRSTLALLADYLCRQVQRNGLVAYSYEPVFGRTRATGTAGRVLHAMTALADAGRILGRPDFVATAAKGIGVALDHVVEGAGDAIQLPGLSASVGADAELLLGLVALGDSALLDPRGNPVRERLLTALQPDGRIDRSARRRMRAEHDFLPGLLLLALASYPGELPDLGPQLAWYQRRFELLHPWGMVGWHPQAWRQVWEAGRRSPALPEFVRELVDWALLRQHHRSGAFLTDLNLTGPSFHTAFVMEGVADAARLMVVIGDETTAGAYMRAWRRGFLLLDRLIIRDSDTFCMQDPITAVGGVRATLTSAQVRVDFVSHAVQAIVKALQYAAAASRWEVDTHVR